jgi:Amt family ammonium transporter
MATHWAAAENGWLSVLGFDDFAFSGVVHSLGGAASLAAAYVAGPRKDHFLPDGITVHEIPSNSIAVRTIHLKNSTLGIT